MTQVTPTLEIAKRVRPLIGGLVDEYGPVAVARGLFHAGCKLIAHGRGRGEAQAELRNVLARAYNRARGARDIDDEPIADPGARQPPFGSFPAS